MANDLSFSCLTAPLSDVDAGRLADMHLAQLPGRMLPLLGHTYLCAFYRYMVKSAQERVFVARSSGPIVGLCIVTEDEPGVLRRAVVATLPIFLRTAVIRFFTSGEFRRACLAVLQSGSRSPANPLILILFTAPGITGRGVGGSLIAHVARNLNSEFLFTKTEDEPGNPAISFYKKNGFQLAAKEVYANRAYLSLRRKAGPSGE
jgi:GNAT superfamily N-acetyltransferase